MYTQKLSLMNCSKLGYMLFEAYADSECQISLFIRRLSFADAKHENKYFMAENVLIYFELYTLQRRLNAIGLWH